MNLPTVDLEDLVVVELHTIDRPSVNLNCPSKMDLVGMSVVDLPRVGQTMGLVDFKRLSSIGWERTESS